MNGRLTLQFSKKHYEQINIAIVTVCGKLTLHNTGIFRQYIHHVINHDMENMEILLIDFSESTSIDIILFGIVIQINSLLKTRDKSLKFRNLPHHIKMLLDNSPLEECFFDDMMPAKMKPPI